MTNKIFLQLLRTSLTILSLVCILSISVSAQPSTKFDIDSKGNARMEFTEDIDLELDEATFVLSGSDNAPIFISGTLTSYDTLEPEYTLKLNSDSTKSELDFKMWGEDIMYILGAYGEFDLNISLKESGNKAILTIEGEASKNLFNLLPSADINYLISEDFDVTKAEEDINSLFSEFPLPTKPVITIDTFNISGLFMPDIDISVTIDNWGDVNAFLLSHSYEDVPSSEQFLYCLGLSPDVLISLFLGSDREFTAKLVGFDGEISADILASNTLADSAIPGVKISSLDIDITSDPTTTEITGTLLLNEPDSALSCMLKQQIPGEYTMKSFDYLISKSSGSSAMHSFEAELDNFAEKIGDERKVSFPSELTSDGDIEVSIPSGMSILSVEGGIKENSKTAVSTPGEDFTVTYGPESGGLDTNLIIGGAIVILLLLLLAKRKK